MLRAMDCGGAIMKVVSLDGGEKMELFATESITESMVSFRVLTRAGFL